MRSKLDDIIFKLSRLEGQLDIVEILPGHVINVKMMSEPSSFPMIVRYVKLDDLSVYSSDAVEVPGFVSKKEPGIFASMASYDEARHRYTFAMVRSGYFDDLRFNKNNLMEHLPASEYGKKWVASRLGRINLNDFNKLPILKF